MQTRHGLSLIGSVVVSIGLLLVGFVAEAITIAQEFRGELTPPSRVDWWNYGPDFYTLPNGNIAMVFDSSWHWGTCYKTTPETPGRPPSIDLTSDLLWISERVNGVYQSAQPLICPSNFQDYACPAGPCLDTPRPGQDVFHDADPTIAFFGGLYRLYYTGATSPGTFPYFPGGPAAVFYAFSSDGRNFTKYTNPSTGSVEPVIPTINIPGCNDITGDPPCAWGTGQPSVIADTVNGQNILVMYYSYWTPACVDGFVKRAESTDGVHWTRHRPVLPACTDIYGNNNMAMAVRKMDFMGQPLYFTVTEASPSSTVKWNWSIDGIHFQPWSNMRPIDSGGYRSHNPGLSPSDGSSTIYVHYGSQPCPPPDLCLGEWRIRYTRVTLSPEPAFGWFDSIGVDGVARGWIYDPDRGYNDASSDNFSAPGPAGVGSEYKFLIDGSIETPVFRADGYYAGLVSAGVAPDPWHGVRLDLTGFVGAGSHTATLMLREWPENTFRQLGPIRSFSVQTSGTKFFPVTPCRLVNTFDTVGSLGGPALKNGEVRGFSPGNQCGIPDDALALAANITAVTPPQSGFMTVFPTGTQLVPNTSAISFKAGITRANNALIGLQTGSFSLYPTVGQDQTLNVIIDVSGYFKRP